MRKLMIADDEAGIRSLVRMTLDTGDYEIIEAADGDEALALVREHHPELVLLDAMMPKRSGFDVCRELKEDPETNATTVVMLTARAQEVDRERGTAAGADDYFTKPFSPVALLEKVAEVLGEER
jgi:two-component system phosphate regulon response regulator PhoB